MGLLLVIKSLGDGVADSVVINEFTQVPLLNEVAYYLSREDGTAIQSGMVLKRKGEDLFVVIDDEDVLQIEAFFSDRANAIFELSDSDFIATQHPITAGNEQIIWEAGSGASGFAGLDGFDWKIGAGALGALAAASFFGGGSSGGSSGSDDSFDVTSTSTAQSIAEQSGANQVVYTATSNKDGITWSLAEGSDSAVSINAETGNVTLTENPDFESKSEYVFTVVATRSGETATQVVTLSISDVEFNGLVHDDYLFGSTVFIDSNNNGELDSEETSTTTDAQGKFSFDFDVNGAPVVAVGGYDSASGVQNTATYKALAFGESDDASGIDLVLSPLTTLIYEVANQSNTDGSDITLAEFKSAADVVASTLGIQGGGEALLTFDPVAAAQGENPNSQLLTLSRQLAMTSHAIGSVIEGAKVASPLEDQSGSALTNESMAALIVTKNETGETLDLSSGDDMSTLISSTVTESNLEGLTSGLQFSNAGDVDVLASLFAQMNARLADSDNENGSQSDTSLDLIRAMYLVVGPELVSVGEQAASNGGNISSVQFVRDLSTFVDSGASLDVTVDDYLTQVANLNVSGSFDVENVVGFVGSYISLNAQYVGSEGFTDAPFDAVYMTDHSGLLDVLLPDSQTQEYASIEAEENGDYLIPLDSLEYIIVRAESPLIGQVSFHAMSDEILTLSTLNFGIYTEIAVSDIAISNDTGESASDFITSQEAQVITATLSSELNTTVSDAVDANFSTQIVERLYGSVDGGVTWTDISSKVSGTTVTWDDASLEEGAYSIQLKVSDEAGNDRPTASQNYVLDSETPVVFVESLSVLNTEDSSKTAFIMLSSTLSQEDVLEASLDGGQTWTALTEFSTLRDVAIWRGLDVSDAGSMLFRVTDVAGNQGTVLSLDYEVSDASSSIPSTPDLADSDDLGVSDSDNVTSKTTNLTFTGTAELGTTVELFSDANGNGQIDLGESLGSADVASGSWSIDASLEEGTHAIKAMATDLVGNQSSASDALSVTIDVLTPTATLSDYQVSTEYAQVQLEATGVTDGSDLRPQVASVGQAGEYVVTWYGQDGNDDSIYVQKFNADGTPSGNQAVMLEGVNTTDGNDLKPQVTEIGANGDYVVTWYGADSTGSGNSVFVQTFNADGSLTGHSTVQLDRDASVSHDNPQVMALGTSGEFVVAWNAFDGASYSVFVQQFNADGTTTDRAVVPLDAPGVSSGDDLYPQMTYLGTSGEYVVVWNGYDGNDNSIYFQKFNADGSVSGHAIVKLEGRGVTVGNDYYPQIETIGTEGEFAVVWHGQDSDASDADDSIFIQVFHADSSEKSDVIRIEADDVILGDDNYPKIASVGTSGEFVVTWQGPDSGIDDADNSIYVQKFDANGDEVGRMVTLEAQGTIGKEDYFPEVASLGDSGEYVVTWQGQDSDTVNADHSIFVQHFNADGTTSGHSMVKLEATGSEIGDDWYPQIAHLGNTGEYVVTWYGNDGEDDSIFVQKFAEDGSTQKGIPANDDSGSIVAQSTALGTVYLVALSQNISTAAEIEALPTNQWRSVEISAINTDVDINTSGLVNGDYRLYSVDEAGNLSAVAQGFAVVSRGNVDIGTSTPDLAEADDSGRLTTDNVTNRSSSLTLSGSAESGLNVELFNDVNENDQIDEGESLGSTVSAEGGWRLDVSLSEGTHNLKTIVSNGFGQTSEASPALTVEVDQTAPPSVSNIAISTDSGVRSSDLLTNVAGQTVTAELSADLASGELLYASVDSGASWTEVTDKVSSTSVTWDTATLVEGSHTIQFKVVDLAGNEGTVASQAYELDQTPPDAVFTAVSFNESVSKLTLTGANLSEILSDVNLVGLNIKSFIDWSKVRWDIDHDGDVSGNPVFTEAGIVSAIIVNDTTAEIVFVDANDDAVPDFIQDALPNQTGFDPLDDNDVIVIKQGFVVDAAGNASETDGFTGPVTLSGVVQVSLSGQSNVDEGGIASYTVSLDQTTSIALQVEVQISHGTTNATDLTAENRMITIPAGADSATFTVSNTDDSASEGSETYRLALTGDHTVGGSFESVSVDTTAVSTVVDDNDQVASSTTDIIFNLIEGTSSSHSGRDFANISEPVNIYIVVSSDSHALSTDGEHSDATITGESWGVWQGGHSIASGSKIILVGSGADIQGFNNQGITKVSMKAQSNETSALYVTQYSKVTETAGGGTTFILANGTAGKVGLYDTVSFARLEGGNSSIVSALWNGNVIQDNVQFEFATHLPITSGLSS